MSHDDAKEDGLTQPLQASAFRKGGYILLKDHPCKIVDMSTSKTGKHGHAKVKFTGIDIFTNNKYQELQSSTHNMSEVIVTKTQYAVSDISESALVDMLSEDGEFSQIQLNEDKYNSMDKDPPIEAQIKAAFEAVDDQTHEIQVVVTRAMGHEAILDFKQVAL